MGFWRASSFYRVQGSKLAGVAPAAVPSRNTSRSCSECGYCDKANRRSRSESVCKSCGYVALADENAALNIRSRTILNQPTVACAEASLFTHSYRPTALAVGSCRHVLPEARGRAKGPERDARRILRGPRPFLRHVRWVNMGSFFSCKAVG